MRRITKSIRITMKKEEEETADEERITTKTKKNKQNQQIIKGSRKANARGIRIIKQ